MDIQSQIQEYINSHAEPKRNELERLHLAISDMIPKGKLWFLDGRNSEGKIVSNPNVGYGAYNITYTDGSIKEFYQIGLSANTTGISVYIMGIKDKNYLADTYEKHIGKAKVSGYCIKFKTLKDINLDILFSAIRFGVEQNK